MRHRSSSIGYWLSATTRTGDPLRRAARLSGQVLRAVDDRTGAAGHVLDQPLQGRRGCSFRGAIQQCRACRTARRHICCIRRHSARLAAEASMHRRNCCLCASASARSACHPNNGAMMLSHTISNTMPAKAGAGTGADPRPYLCWSPRRGIAGYQRQPAGWSGIAWHRTGHAAAEDHSFDQAAQQPLRRAKVIVRGNGPHCRVQADRLKRRPCPRPRKMKPSTVRATRISSRMKPASP